jgi:ubiquitin carboxyl-terminal hydrolase 12/46
MGNTTSSKLQAALKSPDTFNLSPKTRYYGFENVNASHPRRSRISCRSHRNKQFGNTCYCNAVLQALYHCARFRQRLREFVPDGTDEPRTLLAALALLFDGISASAARTGVVAPHSFLKRLRKANELFRAPQQQDAHEFLNYLLNDISSAALVAMRNDEEDDDEEDEDEAGANGAKPTAAADQPRLNGADAAGHLPNGTSKKRPPESAKAKRSFVQDLFEGVLTNETRCLRCESITSRDETFLDLSVDVTQNSSISHCFANFCAVERLAAGNKFFCDSCNTLQEAQKSLHVRRAPPVLVLHLKRFKFVDRYNCHKKLAHRVAFPFDLRLGGAPGEPASRYSLLAVVVHRGGGPNSGHYFSYVRSESNWLLFNDRQIELVDRATVQAVFGSARETTGATLSTAYILFYERVSDSDEHGG